MHAPVSLAGPICYLPRALPAFSERVTLAASPWVTIAGDEWRLTAYPQGLNEGQGSHLSGEGAPLCMLCTLCLLAGQQVDAAWKFEPAMLPTVQKGCG